MMIMKTGIYIRVSTEEQAKTGFSIRAQQEKLVSYANIRGWDIHDIYIDEGISGKNLEREAIKRLINDIKQQKINNVLVFKIDRLTRSTKDLIELLELFKDYNCDFNSLTESIDTSSPTGRMFIKIIGLFAEFERETIVERIKLGLERKVKEGYSLCSSTTSYGYDRKKGEKVQNINIEESKIVKMIYDMYLNNVSINDIKRHLTSNRIKTKKNKEWSNKMILNILTNPNYIGKVRYGINKKNYFEKEGKHKGIIDKNKYENVQELLRNRLKTKEDAYYSNKLFCICKNKIVTKRTYINKKCYINYRCLNPDCNIKNISHNYLNKYIKLKKEDVQMRIKHIIILDKNKRLLIIYKYPNNFTLSKK